MNYKVEYRNHTCIYEYFTDALSHAEQLYHAGIDYVCVKENGRILIEFENQLTQMNNYATI